MTPRDLVELFEYDGWATDRVLDAAGRAGEAFLTERGPSVGSVRELLTHVGDAQVNWIRRLQGQPSQREPFDRFPTVDDVRAHCREANARVRGYLSALSSPDFERELRHTSVFDGKQYSNSARQILLQVFAHGIHHRAEASDLLSRAGHTPEPLELIQYYRSRASG